MSNLIKYILVFMISFNLYSNKANLMDDFFSLQKEKKSISRDINLIYLTHSLGYPEKSIQKLYILLDKFNKEDFDKNIKEIHSILKDKVYNKEILNSLDFLANGIKHPKMDKETISIYESKKPVSVEMNDRSSLPEAKKGSIEKKDKDLAVTTPKHWSKSDKILNEDTKKVEKNKNLAKDIELAIVLSEWLDDFDIDNSIKYSEMFKADKYYKELLSYLKYLKTKNYKELELLNQKSPTLYHILISIYKKEKNQEKVLIYTDKLKKEFPYYLKYNKI